MSRDKQPAAPGRVPNATTLRAMKELEKGKGKRYADAEALFEDIAAPCADSHRAPLLAARQGKP